MNTHDRAQRDLNLYVEYTAGKRHGLTQADLATKYGVDRSVISKRIRHGKGWYEWNRAYEETVQTSTNGFPGHLENTGDE